MQNGSLAVLGVTCRYPVVMEVQEFYRLDSISVVDVNGSDASAIVHNLTTNEVRDLSEGMGRESFVTDARGKTLAHVLVFREQDSLRLIAAGGNSQKLSEHIDRYTIREDATPQIRDEEFVALVVAADEAKILFGSALDAKGEPLGRQNLTIDEWDVVVYSAPWLGTGSRILLAEAQNADQLCQALQNKTLHPCDESAFHARRTQLGFPWFGIDIDENNLPQEVDRDAETISLTKGCYLGQETVARLDALGQVQKKLVRWSIAGGVPEAGSTLTADEKKVGRLTSVAAGGEDDAVAIGFARRTHFDPGATAEGVDSSGNPFTGRVC